MCCHEDLVAADGYEHRLIALKGHTTIAQGAALGMMLRCRRKP